MTRADSGAEQAQVERERQQAAGTHEAGVQEQKYAAALKKLEDMQAAQLQQTAQQQQAAQQLQAQLQAQLHALQGQLQGRQWQAAPCAQPAAQPAAQLAAQPVAQPVAQLAAQPVAPWAYPPAHTMYAPPLSQAPPLPPVAHQLPAAPFFGGLDQQLPATAHQAWCSAHMALSRPPLAPQLVLTRQELKRKAELLEQRSTMDDLRNIMSSLGGYSTYFG